MKNEVIKINKHATGEFMEAITKAQDEWDGEVEQINSKNEWLHYLSGSLSKTPYLKATGRSRKKSRVVHMSTKQRRGVCEC